ncbi:leucine rich repeat protein [Scheffersomyces xylosifermentans]|uniref:leucine rich repeat protein n=1 Tax=Scheffersomyces xylosifermentans TaxID=1304137 RepID=UPI00315D62DA
MPNTLPINSFPQEILDGILSQLELEELSQFLKLKFYIDQNPNIFSAIVRRILTSNITYNNRIIQNSFLHMYKRTPSYINKKTLQYITNASFLIDLVKANRQYRLPTPANPITISFYIWSISDISEFLTLVEGLGSSSFTFNLELEFDPSINYNVDLAYILNRCLLALNETAPALQSLMVTNYTGEFAFEVSKYSSLKHLWLENTNVKLKSSFKSNLALKDLQIHPNLMGFNNNRPVYLHKSVPECLTELRLGNCNISERSLRYPIPINLKRLELTKVKDLSEEHVYTKTLIAANLMRSLETLHIDKVYDVNYTRLSLESLLPDHSTIEKLKSLILTSFPMQLTALNISNNGLHDINGIGKLFPNSLQMLNLADNDIDWQNCNVDFTRFNNLKSLKLSNTRLGPYISMLHFPNSVEALSLEVNQITSIDEIKFPDNLKDLGIGCNEITEISRHPMIPKGIHTIHLTENKLSGYFDLSKNRSGEDLDLEVLYLNFNKFHDIHLIHVPKKLKILNFDDCKFRNLENFDFQDSLVELSFSGCDINNLRNINFNKEKSNLKYFNISQNRIANFDNLGLPNSLEILDVSSNRIANFKKNTSCFASLERLKIVNLSHNNLTNFDIEFHSSLKVLNLSFNKISNLKLSWVDNASPNLSVLNLSSNQIQSFTPDTIGYDHNDVTRAFNFLIEIDLSNNLVAEGAVKEQLQNFPSSLACFFIESSGKQDRFGYDIARNIIDSRLCLGKRIDD